MSIIQFPTNPNGLEPPAALLKLITQSVVAAIKEHEQRVHAGIWRLIGKAIEEAVIDHEREHHQPAEPGKIEPPYRVFLEEGKLLEKVIEEALSRHRADDHGITAIERQARAVEKVVHLHEAHWHRTPHQEPPLGSKQWRELRAN